MILKRGQYVWKIKRFKENSSSGWSFARKDDVINMFIIAL